MKMINPTEGNELADYINKLFGGDMQLWGDSLSSGLAIQIQNNLDSREVDENAFPGHTSSYIRDEFLANADITKAQIIWVGRNNIGNTEIIIDDVQQMVDHLGHDRFLILNAPNNGDASNLNDGNYYQWITELEDRLKSEYPNNFLNIRKGIIHGWNMGEVRLNTSFTQPIIGQNVQINVTDTEFLSDENTSDAAAHPQWTNQIRIGDMYYADLYTIISIDSVNLMTVRLDEVNRFNEGATVDNLTLTDGAIGYWKVVQEMDYQYYNFDTLPSTYKSDLTHPKTQEFAGKLIAKFFNARFI